MLSQYAKVEKAKEKEKKKKVNFTSRKTLRYSLSCEQNDL